MASTEERVGPTPQEKKDMSPEEEQQSSIADDLVRRSALYAFILESPGGTSTETIGIPASCDVSPAQESVLFQGEQPRMHSLEELMEELKEELKEVPSTSRRRTSRTCRLSSSPPLPRRSHVRLTMTRCMILTTFMASWMRSTRSPSTMTRASTPPNTEVTRAATSLARAGVM